MKRDGCIMCACPVFLIDEEPKIVRAPAVTLLWLSSQLTREEGREKAKRRGGKGSPDGPSCA